MSILTAHGVCVTYGDRPVVMGADLYVRAGRVVGLIGPNGAGKSSFLRVLAGLRKPVSGTIRLDATELYAASVKWRARHIAFMPQDIVPPPPMSLRTLVALGRLPHGESGAAARAHPAVEEALAVTGLAHMQDRPASRLSAGERARMHLCRALAVQAPILLADEPIAALDPEHALAVMALLRAIAARGQGVVIVLHDLGLATRFCDELVIMKDGRVWGTGAPGEVLTDDAIRAVYNVTARRLGDVPVPWERCL